MIEIPKQIRLREYLGEIGLTQGELAAKVGVNQAHLSRAANPTDTSFHAFRLRMRMEAVLGILIWTEVEESRELTFIGELLKLNLATATLPQIRKAAAKAKVKRPEIYSRASGFTIFRGLMVHFFPQSKSLTHPHYAI